MKDGLNGKRARWLLILVIMFLNYVTGPVYGGAFDTGEGASSYDSTPPFLSPYRAPMSVLISLDESRSMREFSYDRRKFTPEKGDGLLGIFDAHSWYRYDPKRQYFIADKSLEKVSGLKVPASKVTKQKHRWHGQFLNWLTMRKIDQGRWLLLGTNMGLSSSDRKHFIVSADSSPGYRDERIKLTASIADSRFYSPVENYQGMRVEAGTLTAQGRNYRIAVKHMRSEKGLLSAHESRLRYFLLSSQAQLISEQWEIENRVRQWRLSDKRELAPELRIEKIFDFVIGPQANDLFPDDGHSLAKACTQLMLLNMSSKVRATGKLRSLFRRPLSKDCRADIQGEQSLYFTHLSTGFTNRAEMPAGESEMANYLYLYSDSPQKVLASIMRFTRKQLENALLQREFVGASSLSIRPAELSILYQSRFKLESVSGQRHDFSGLVWRGDIFAQMLDEDGLLRNDNGDQTLGSLEEDPYLDSCFDASSGLNRHRLSNSLFKRPSLAERQRCSPLDFPVSSDELTYLWRASDSSASLSMKDRLKQRTPFQQSSERRYIRTSIGGTEYDFSESFINDSNYKRLKTLSVSEAKKLVNLTRANHQADLTDADSAWANSPFRDFINSRPAVVAAPSGAYDVLHGDVSYRAFKAQYQNRRELIYVGGNDGMLHSFNGGWRQARKVVNEDVGSAKWKLGQEVWAFIPEAYLSELSALNASTYRYPEHRFLMNGSPYVFDARIFTDSGVQGQPDRIYGNGKGLTHPNGWGTVLVMGAGVGGASGAANPGFLIFDITDSEQAPRLLAEFNHPDLGRSSSQPTALTLQLATEKSDDQSLDWFLAFGSGEAGNKAKLFILDLSTMRLAESIGKKGVLSLQAGSTEQYAPVSIGGISAVDYQQDGVSDALYFGTIEGDKHQGLTNSPALSGGLYRLDLMSYQHQETRYNRGTITAAQAERVFNAGGPIVERPVVSLGQDGSHWLYFSTGRLQTRADYLELERGTQSLSQIVAIKDPYSPASNNARRRFPSYEQLEPISITESVAVKNERLNSESYRGWYGVLPPRQRFVTSARINSGFVSIAAEALVSYSCEIDSHSVVYQFDALSGAQENQNEAYKPEFNKLGNNPRLGDVGNIPASDTVLQLLNSSRSSHKHASLGADVSQWRIQSKTTTKRNAVHRLTWREK